MALLGTLNGLIQGQTIQHKRRVAILLADTEKSPKDMVPRWRTCPCPREEKLTDQWANQMWARHLSYVFLQSLGRRREELRGTPQGK